MIDIRFADPALPDTGALALFLAENASLTGLARALDEKLGGAITRAIAAADWKGKDGDSLTLLAPGGGLTRVVLVGLGKPGEPGPSAFLGAGGLAAQALAREGTAALVADAADADAAVHLAEGAALRAYRFDRHRTREKPEEKPKLASLTVFTDARAKAEAAWPARAAVVHGVFAARDLISEPANILTPTEFANRIEALRALGLTVELFGPDQLRELKFGAMLGVAQGSAEEPRMAVMEWRGGGEDKPVAFIGKGVTFDTGGISIKPAQGMEDMKWDMAGAGAVTGLMAALAGRRAKVNAVGLVGLVENMPSGTAQRPGDVVTTASGQTVEVLNTDAEGRLVLADVLHYARTRFSPRFMIDLATLTGAMIVALGHEQAGLFANDDTLANHLLEAGQASGEKLWRLPLGPEYDKQLKSDIADMKNITGRPGSSITAAQFLKRFVGDTPWAHLDIAGTAWAQKDTKTTPKGAAAFGVRLLDHLVRAHYEA